MLRIIVIGFGILFFLLGAAEMHVQQRPVHRHVYPPIESPLHNTEEAPRGE